MLLNNAICIQSKTFKTLFFFCHIFFFSLASAADLQVVAVNSNSLPYEFSPTNYYNSPINYDNSIINFDNSPTNFDNAETNFINSSNNYENSSNGKNRILLNRSGTFYFAGYYVIAPNGIINFFSSRGKRMFYSPKNGKGVFGGTDGDFYGVLANFNGRLSLGLTEQGIRMLQLSQ